MGKKGLRLMRCPECQGMMIRVMNAELHQRIWVRDGDDTTQEIGPVFRTVEISDETHTVCADCGWEE